ncbi:MAG: hypothetical protein MRY21_01415 [Simkaniaceae bacterium]|nr:hypothetical protein [Simkaniaceae bacterium]
MKKLAFSILLITSLFSDEGMVINFPSVKASELVKFVSQVAQVNFVYDENDLDFQTTLISGRPVLPSELLNATVAVLKKNSLRIHEDAGYIHIHKDPSKSPNLPYTSIGKDRFQLYKIQYSKGMEILTAIRQIAKNVTEDAALTKAVDSIHWLESSNSLIFTADSATADQVVHLIETLDRPQRQVFIEVLVLETDMKTGLDLGLEWSAVGKYKDQLGAGLGNFPARNGGSQLAKTLQTVSSRTGSDIPLSEGFNLGVIGDLILFKGKALVSLGSLLSALESDGQSSVVLHQKVLTQDNKQSKIFVGDNIPFAGSIVETVGNSQQTTSNIDYRDVGVSLNITPYLGKKDIITLELAEEITEALNSPMVNSKSVSGIQTTKTNMVTRVHVPDRHFLILSGMMRNAKSQITQGVPCLGAIPGLGAAFSKDTNRNDKRNIVVFVRPHIIDSLEDMQVITSSSRDEFLEKAPPRIQKSLEVDLPSINNAH